MGSRQDLKIDSFADLSSAGSSPVLVTGGGGFVGSAIVHALRKKELTVRSFSRSRYGELERLGVEQIQGDLVDFESVARACRGCALVFHVAARAGIWGSRREFYDTNVEGTRSVIKACLQEKVGHLVYTSSPSVVFNGRDMEGADESVPYPSHYKADYPATKAAAEKLVRDAGGGDLATVALRPHLVWGPGDPHIIPGLIRRARAGQLRRIGHGGKKVDFTYIDNVAHAHLLAAECLCSKPAISGRTFFITDGSPVELWEFVNEILELAGVEPVEKSVPTFLAYGAAAVVEGLYRVFNVREEPRATRFLVEELATSHWFDISAARRDLGYRPLVDRETGMARLRAWLLESGLATPRQDQSSASPPEG